MNAGLPRDRNSATVAIVRGTDVRNVVQFQTAYSIDEFSELVVSNIEWLYGGPDGGKYTLDSYLRAATPGVPLVMAARLNSYCRFIMVKGLKPSEARSELLLFISKLTPEALEEHELRALLLPKHWSRLQTNVAYEEAVKTYR